MMGLYIHIPFCKKKCKYCSFYSFVAPSDTQTKYINRIIKDLSKHKNKNFKTLYIGGGTPSVLSEKLLEKLFLAIEKIKKIKDFKESTFEANPESLSINKIKLLKRFGFSRVSLGAQSFDNKTLKTIGRLHTDKKVFEVFDNLKKHGFDNINLDLIAGCFENFKSFKHSLKQIIKLSPTHISVYGLSVEEGSYFFNKKIFPEESFTLKCLLETRKQLLKNKYCHYEISNYCKKGKENLHNINYWKNGEYLGLGDGATSYIGGTRFQKNFSEKLKGKEKQGEKMMLGLRMLDGIKPNKVFDKEIKELKKLKLIEQKKDKIKLTEKAIFISNRVFEYFVKPFED